MEIEKLSDQLKRAFFKEAWHGPSMLELLEGVTAESAAAKPLSEAHSIWEIVLHIAVWERVVADRLEGKYYQPSDEEDWPPVTDSSGAAWEKAVQDLKDNHRDLGSVVGGIDDDALHQAVPGKKLTRYFLIQGVIQHAAYHAGQIALLKKVSV